MSVPALFVLATAIWGSTWYVITFQLGPVPPEVSVVYRFALASALLAAWCAATGRPLAFRPATHAWLAFWGAMMFGLSYVAVYYAEAHVASGLVAGVFATMAFTCPIGMRLFFGDPLPARIGVAATLGVAGVALLFLPELRVVGDGGSLARGIAWALAGTLISTGGTLAAVRNGAMGLPMLPATAWGMFYGALSAAVVAFARGAAWTFDQRASYGLSLVYLAVPGSVIAFAAYLTLIRRVGAGPAAYVSGSTPVGAMLLSTLYEGYRWSALALLGALLAFVGGVLALRPPKSD